MCGKKCAGQPMVAVAAPICATPFRDVTFARPAPVQCDAPCGSRGGAACNAMLPGYGRSGYAGGNYFLR
jgi:hypothetical protein